MSSEHIKDSFAATAASNSTAILLSIFPQCKYMNLTSTHWPFYLIDLLNCTLTQIFISQSLGRNLMHFEMWA